MQLDLILKEYSGNAVFVIPRVFLKNEFVSSFKEGTKLTIGKKYRVLIEEIE